MKSNLQVFYDEFGGYEKTDSTKERLKSFRRYVEAECCCKGSISNDDAILFCSIDSILKQWDLMV